MKAILHVVSVTMPSCSPSITAYLVEFLLRGACLCYFFMFFFFFYMEQIYLKRARLRREMRPRQK